MRLIPMGALKTEKGVPYSRVHLYRLIGAGKFPRPVHCGNNRIAFLEAEVDQWIASKIRERDTVGEAA